MPLSIGKNMCFLILLLKSKYWIGISSSTLMASFNLKATIWTPLQANLTPSKFRKLCSFYLEETQLDPISSQSEVISKYYKESIQTSLLSIQIDKYEKRYLFWAYRVSKEAKVESHGICFLSFRVQFAERDGRLEEFDGEVLDLLQAGQCQQLVHGIGADVFLFLDFGPSGTRKDLYYLVRPFPNQTPADISFQIENDNLSTEN